MYMQARRKRCGMAAVAAPKNLQGERERKGREGRKEREKTRKKRERRKRKGRGDQERKIYYAYMGVKHSFRTVKKIIKDTKRRGLKKAKKAGREEEETKKKKKKGLRKNDDIDRGQIEM